MNDRADPRLARIQAQIMALAAGDLSTRGEVSGDGDELDAIVEGLNMLAEDFRDREEARVRAEIERERLARQSQRLERSNEALQEFAYVASHDLQEPLRMISSYTQLLLRRYGDQLDEDAHRFIHYAADGAQRMKALIEDLLQYSRVGGHSLRLAPTDTSALVWQAMQLLEVVITETGTTVEVASLPTVRADAQQLGRVFQNLIGNAIKYRSSDPPRIVVDARHVGWNWHFRVRDNGIGFEPRHAEVVFGIFQRLHTRGEYTGTGVGLAVCRKVISAHGGRIWAESEPGVGTTFHFTLPLGLPDSPTPAAEEPAPE